MNNWWNVAEIAPASAWCTALLYCITVCPCDNSLFKNVCSCLFVLSGIWALWLSCIPTDEMWRKLSLLLYDALDCWIVSQRVHVKIHISKWKCKQKCAALCSETVFVDWDLWKTTIVQWWTFSKLFFFTWHKHICLCHVKSKFSNWNTVNMYTDD